uniref:EF-hand domain-containing protein n=1 Tax=Oryza nivara TaxID=4536 RepID=A0A0E0GVF3_ORYNI
MGVAWSSRAAAKRDVRVAVIGDHGTGKSSLVATITTGRFPDQDDGVARVLPPARLPVTIVDTSSRPNTLERITTFWLPKIRRLLQLKVPVILAGCKVDLSDKQQQAGLENVLDFIMCTFREVEIYLECSALHRIKVDEVFYCAQMAVLHPTTPLFDKATRSIKPRCMMAFQQIFSLYDRDKDGAVSDAEMNAFLVRCFKVSLQPAEIADMKRVVQQHMIGGVNDNGLITFIVFLYLHVVFIAKGREETTWAVLRKFGYDNELVHGFSWWPRALALQRRPIS